MGRFKRRTIYPVSTNAGLIYKVPVDDNDPISYAIVEGHIWDELSTLGLNPRLSFKDGHVSFRVGYRYYPMGYLVADCTNEDTVGYKDGNRYNLRQENIIVHTHRKEVKKYRDWLGVRQRINALSSVDYAEVQRNGI